MTIALFTIGTELTRGELVDSNSAFLADALTALGFEVAEMLTVDDDDERIVSALVRLARIHRIIVCTGGLGPTTDDRTSACVARAMNVPLVRNQEAHRSLISTLQARGRAISPSNEKQVDFPEGATVLSNPCGTAPGFLVDIGKAACFFMPGVPTEMQAMFEREVLPRLPQPETRVLHRRLRTFGLPESEVNDRLQGMEETYGVQLGYRASNSEIEVKILTKTRPAEAPEAFSARAEAARLAVLQRLGAAVYAEGTVRLPEALGLLLKEAGWTFGVAESCTGGLVSELMTSVPGASEYFFGGITSYANSVKEGLLAVRRDTLQDVGAVSEEVARQMAEGARRILGVDIALSLTGIAGPGGGSAEKPVGLVYFAIATPDGTVSDRRVFRGDRRQIQMRAALTGLWAVRAAVRESGRCG